MDNVKKLYTPLTREQAAQLRAGDTVLITGAVITGRDAAHKRLVQLLDEGKPLPVALEGQIIYYVGPAPAKPGYASGSAGPTSSYRMDKYAPRLLDLGLRGMIGKGLRGPAVIDAMKRNKSVYFAAVGGAAALISKSIVSSEVVAYEDLGAEAIRRLEVVDFPAVVAIDCLGNNLYETGPQRYRAV
jgi:fumarate hydratase subunit beta